MCLNDFFDVLLFYAHELDEASVLPSPAACVDVSQFFSELLTWKDAISVTNFSFHDGHIRPEVCTSWFSRAREILSAAYLCNLHLFVSALP